MRILYLGDTKLTSGSAQRARAFERLGHNVSRLDMDSQFVSGRVASIIHYRSGYRFLQRNVERGLEKLLAGQTYDVAWVDSGALLGSGAIEKLRRHAKYVVNYNCDDPTGPRDWSRWHSFRKAIPNYDALVVVREESEREYKALGAQKLIRVFRSYDEVDLRPRKMQSDEKKHWASDVLFVGTWMPERGPFLVELLKRGVPLKIYGNRWQKAPQWNQLKRIYQGRAIEGPDYVAAVQCAKIALGLLSKGNRDLHTIRSSEIPYIGSLFCAERTVEHNAMYADDCEAVFWTTPEECAEKCRVLLSDEPRRQAIAEAGHQKVLALKLSHAEVLHQALAIAAAMDH